MGEARRRKEAASRLGTLPKQGIAEAIRSAVVETAQAMKIRDGLCAIHAAVGQRVLRDRFGLSASLVAGDFQRVINERVTHSYAPDGTHVDAAAGACHVWLLEPSTKSLIDFDAWEEPVRYEASGSPHGPWTAPRPNFYWRAPGEPACGIAKVVADPAATEIVSKRLQHGATALFVATAAAKALQYLDLLLV